MSCSDTTLGIGTLETGFKRWCPSCQTAHQKRLKDARLRLADAAVSTARPSAPAAAPLQLGAVAEARIALATALGRRGRKGPRGELSLPLEVDLVHA